MFDVLFVIVFFLTFAPGLSKRTVVTDGLVVVALVVLFVWVAFRLSSLM